MTVLLPQLMGGTSDSTVSVPTEVEVIQFAFPQSAAFEMAGLAGKEISLTSIQAIGVFAALIIVPVIVVGGGLAFVIRLAANITDATKENAAFKASVSALEQRGNERLKHQREGRKSHPIPSHKMPRWSVISTSTAFLMFAAFFGYLLNGTFYPEGEILNDQGELVNTTLYTVGGSVLFVLLIILWRIRPQKLETESSDVSAIPWDSIAVLLTFLIVVGLGIGYIVYLNFPN
jgi:hypothetical protein